MQTSQETKSQKKNNKKKEEEKVGSYTTDRIKKDIKIIDETGGASAEIYLKSKEFQEDDYGKTFLYSASDFHYSIANSMTDMNKGFLMADRLSPKKDLSKREKILQKYNSQMKNLKSQMQSCVNRKSYANSLLVTMDHEFETLTDSIKLEESSLLLLNNSLQAIKHIVESTWSSEDLINHFKEFYLEFKARDKESRKLVQCNNLSNSFKTSEANLNNLGWLLSEDFKIATLLLKMLSSLLSKEWRDVDFSQNPLHMFDTIANFREFLLKILEDSVASFAGDEGDGLFGYSRLQEKEFENGKKTVDAYLTILLQNTIYHHLRQFISVKWNPMTQHNLTDFFEKWINLMPLRLYIHILVSYVEPKLKFEINKVSISNIVESSFYSWISPWIKIFDQISSQHNLKIWDSLKVTIRLCLIQILKEWHPSNTEITTEIQKWRTIRWKGNWPLKDNKILK